MVASTALQGEVLSAALVCSWKQQLPEGAGHDGGSEGGRKVVQLGTITLTAAEAVGGKFSCSEECLKHWNGKGDGRKELCMHGLQ